MKAIIIAAGLGTRLHPLTLDTPKCLLQVGSHTMLEHQIQAYRTAGIKDIVVIVGYQAERFPDLGVTYVLNDRYRHNSVLNSLMYAEQHMTDGFITSYADLIFGSALVAELLKAPHDIVLSIDDTWRSRYTNLEFHPVQAVEKVMYDQTLRISELGKPIDASAPGEFIGLTYVTPIGAKAFCQAFHQAKAEYWGQPFQRASTFEKADLTDLLQFMIEGDQAIFGLVQSRYPWVEVDTEEDLKLARNLFAKT